jgi:hypothetical protein
MPKKHAERLIVDVDNGDIEPAARINEASTGAAPMSGSARFARVVLQHAMPRCHALTANLLSYSTTADLQKTKCMPVF